MERLEVLRALTLQKDLGIYFSVLSKVALLDLSAIGEVLRKEGASEDRRFRTGNALKDLDWFIS